jgi:hypothetical protein
LPFEVTGDLAAQIKNVANALQSYSDNVLGASTSDSFAASWKISNAFFTIKKIFGVVDAGFILAGSRVSTGSLVTGYGMKADNGDADVGFKLALSKDVVAGLSVSALLTLSSGTPISDPANWYDYSSTATTAQTAPMAGLQLNAGYATDMFGVQVGAIVGDLGARDTKASTFALSVAPSLTLKDVAGLNVGLELDLSRGQWGTSAAGTTPGLGLGAKVGLNVVGIAPTITFKMKTLDFKGDNTYNLDGSDAIATGSLDAAFTSLDGVKALASDLDIALAVDLKELIGVKLVTISGDFGTFITEAYNTTAFGWSAGVAFDFNEVLKLPLTFSWSIGQFDSTNNGMVNDFNLGYTIAPAVIGVEFKSSGSSGPAPTYTNALYVTASVSF